jgi:hypothetical protein
MVDSVRSPLPLVALAALFSLSPQRQAPAVVSISGVAMDGLTGLPLNAANVQLVGVDPAIATRRGSTVTSVVGDFKFDSLPPGRYLLGFYHRAIDTLGIETRGMLVDARHSDQRIVLSGPSAALLIQAFCGDVSTSDSTTLLLGHVHDADDERAVGGVRVVATWSDVHVDRGALAVGDRSAAATTRVDGLFALCGLAKETPIDVRAVRGNDSTGAVPIRIPAAGVRHLTLFVAPESARRGRITGRILDTGRDTVPRAQITVIGSSRTAMTGVGGRFVLDSVATGTQLLETRAIGYAPLTMSVRVTTNDSTSVEVLLERAAVLPTVYTMGRKSSANLALYEAHKRSAAAGFFVQPRRIEGYPSLQYLHSVVQGVPNANVRSIMGQWVVILYKPGTTMYAGPRDPCIPALYLNGQKTMVDFDDLDQMIDPDDILGVEVYRTEIEIPRIYDIKNGAKCGLLSIWTKIHEGPVAIPVGKPPR